MSEQEPYATSAKMWGMTSEPARVRLVSALKVDGEPESPKDDYLKQAFDNLPTELAGRLMLAATPDGWNPPNLHEYVDQVNKLVIKSRKLDQSPYIPCNPTTS